MAEEIAKGGGANELSTDLPTITAEINAYQRVAGEAIFEIGRRLKHVKETLMKEKHGEWSEFCGSVNMDVRLANKFIRIVDGLDGKWSTSTTLGFEALYQIATLPPEQREAEHTTSKGETKTPVEMTVKELRDLKRQLRAEQAERERLEEEATRLHTENAELSDRLEEVPKAVEPEVRVETRTEYVETVPEDYERKIKRYEELFGEISMYDGSAHRITNGDAITYAVYEFSEDVRKFIEKYGHLTYFVNEFNEMIGEGKEEYRKAINSMFRFMEEIERNLDEEDVIIINE